MKFNIWDILIVVAGIQGAVTGTIICLRDSKNISSLTVSLILYALTLGCIGALIAMQPYSPLLSSLDRYIPYFLTFAFGPLVYFHTKGLVNPIYNFRRKDLLHFSLILINLFPSLLNIGYWFGSSIGFISLPYEKLLPLLRFYYTYVDTLAWLHITAYLFLARKILIDRPKPSNSKKSKDYRQWLKVFLNALIIFQIIWIVFIVIEISTPRSFLYQYGFIWYLLYIPMSLLGYWTGVKYLMDMSQYWSLNSGNALISQTEVDKIRNRLDQIMQNDKPFLDPELSIITLAEKVGTSPKNLSYVLNQSLNAHFNDYINEKRIIEVKNKLSEDNSKQKTIAAIALDSGFNSIPTFQRVFKAKEGITPKQFQKEVINNTQIRN